MTTYLTTVGIQIGGQLVAPRTRLDHTDKRIEALGKAEVARLIAQGYFRVLGIQRNTEPGRPLNEHPPLPTGVRTNVEGTRVLRAEFGDPDKGGKTINYELPVPVGPVDRDPSDRPSPPPKRERKAKKAKQPGEPNGKWNLEPEAVADQDIDTLNALVHDIDPDRAPFEPGQEAQARTLLTKDNRPGPAPENLVSVSGDLDPGQDKNRRATRRQPKTKRAPAVRRGA